MLSDVNFLGVALAALANMVIGSLWYSPLLFGKPWMRLTGMSEEECKDQGKGMAGAYALMALASIVMATIFSLLLSATETVTMRDGAQLAGLIWLGFIATSVLSQHLFSGKNKSLLLYVINAGYYLTSLCVMSVILVLFI